jgi:hypothetical protein
MRPVRTILLLVTASSAVLAGLTGPAASALAAVPAARSAAQPAAATAFTGGEGHYTPVGPNRILDTRIGLGHGGKVGAGLTINVQVTGGSSGVPTSGASAVVFNLTATNGTETSHVTVFPTGQTRPTATNLNFHAKVNIANLVTVKLASNGQVSMYNGAGSVDLIADVVGWYADASTASTVGGDFQPTATQRLVDTRNTGALGGLQTLTAPVDYSTTTTNPNSHIKALAVTVTVVSPTSGGYLTAWGAGTTPPTASTLNFVGGETVPNMAVVPVTPCSVNPNCPTAEANLPSIQIKNASSGPVNILIDIWGFYDDGSLGGSFATRFVPQPNPIRIADTRISFGATTLGRGSTRTIYAPTTVADANTALLVQNVTAVPSSATYLTLWPAGQSRPNVSSLNPRAHITVANLAYAALGPRMNFDVFNSTGTTDVISDVAGAFELENPPSLAAHAVATGSAAASWRTPALAPAVSR